MIGGTRLTEGSPVPSQTAKGQPAAQLAIWKPDAGMARRYDWVAISKRYIEGVAPSDPENRDRVWPSLADVSSAYGIHPSLLRNAAARYKWRAQRDAFRTGLENEARLLRMKRIAAASVAVDDSAIRATGRGMRVVDKRFEEIEAAQEANAILREKYHALIDDGVSADDAATQTGYDPFEPGIDAREMHALAQSGLALHTLKSRAAGDVESRARVELTGEGGGAIDLRHSVSLELATDSPGRLEDFFKALERSRIGEDEAPLELPPGDGIIDAELVDE